MLLEKLSFEDREIILSCLRAIANGSFTNFINDDSELYTRLGINRSTLHKIIQSWPEIDDSADDSAEALAINNALNEVCHGIRFSETDWSKWFDVDRVKVKAVFNKWKQLRSERESR